MADRRRFPPQVRAEVIRLACERPADRKVPLARWFSTELAREVVARGICEHISGVTVWRWLSKDAIKLWQYRSWIFPRDPQFTTKAGRILDLYSARWEGELLHPGDYVVCCDEKPSIQARARTHTTLPAKPGVRRGQRLEHEYDRRGALCYFAAWDARRAKLFDRCDEKDGIAPFDKLIEQFMSVEPYSTALPIPIRARTPDTVDVAMPSTSAISGPVNRSLLSAAIACTRRSLVRCGIDLGAEDRSTSPSSPSAR